MQTSDFDYELPRELIATHPAERRDESRLLVLHRDGQPLQHRRFSDLTDYIRPGDLLVMNDSRVMKARLRGQRPGTGAAVEALLLAPVDGAAGGHSRWAALCRPAKKFRIGETLLFGQGALPVVVVSEGPEGERTLEFPFEDVLPLLDQHGEIPLPPYIVQRRRETDDDDTSEDLERYQTVYARQQGSVAAPTAGLHFTPALLDQIRAAGAETVFVTLHVGAGTFKPVETDNPAEHPMHLEHNEGPGATATAITETRQRGGRVIAVGTTTVRTLESAWDAEAGAFRPGSQSTRLLILPGYQYQVLDALITNFHLPRSTLLMMISALAGREQVMAAYQAAIREKYRFYSYGDAMLIL